MQTTQGVVLARALADELRARHVLLPPVPVIEKLCATALTRAERATFRRLTVPLTDSHRAALDGLLVVRGGFGISDTGISGTCAGRHNRRNEVHEEAETQSFCGI